MGKNKILVTGAAGFIGYHLSQSLLERGDEEIGRAHV
jgi:UDP-glucuronate 4-epimerase